MAADPGRLSVHDHDLAVVAEVQLKAVARCFSGVEVIHLDPGRTKRVQVSPGQIVTAHLVA